MFLRQHGQCWLDHLRTAAALDAFARALALRPRLPGIEYLWEVATIIHRVTENMGRDTILRMEPRDIAFLPLAGSLDPLLQSLALDELKRIVHNYRDRRTAVPADERVVCYT